MKKTHLLLAIMFTAFGLPATAQWSIGASGGYALNFYNYDPQYMVGMHYYPNHGATINLHAGYRFSNNLAVNGEFSLLQRGFSFGLYKNNSDTLAQYLHRDDHYAMMPVTSSYYFGNGKLQGFIEAGVYIGFWCKSRYAYRSFTYLNHAEPENGTELAAIEREFVPDYDRRFEIGVIGGVGAEWFFCTHFSCAVGIRCHQALTPQQKNYQTKHFPSWNTTLTAQLDINYNF